MMIANGKTMMMTMMINFNHHIKKNMEGIFK
jgi:hypothetical protein